MNILLYPWFLFEKYGKSECVKFAPMFRITESLECE